MRNLILGSTGAALLGLATLLTGCSKLGLGPSKDPVDGAADGPTAQVDLLYVAGTEPGWPPDIKAGPFDEKMTYVSSGIPTGLSKEAEVFLTGVIKAGQTMSSGGSVWLLKLKDGGEVQAVEAPEYTAKQEEEQQSGGHATMLHPYTPGRLLCAYGVYQGKIGMPLNPKDGHVPLVSILFAMDRVR